MNTSQIRVLRRPVESTLAAVIVVMDQPGEVIGGCPRGHLEGLQGQGLGRQASRDVPADDREPRPSRHESDVCDPEPVGCRGGEVALHEVWELPGSLSRWGGGDGSSPSDDAVDPGVAHEAGDLVTADLPACATHRGVHLAHPVDGVVLCMDARELTEQQLVAKPACRRRPCPGGAIAAAGDEPTLRATQRGAQMGSTPN